MPSGISAQVATLRDDVDESFLDPRVVPRPGVEYHRNTDLTWRQPAKARPRKSRS
jgi:hypothetical protein